MYYKYCVLNFIFHNYLIISYFWVKCRIQSHLSCQAVAFHQCEVRKLFSTGRHEESMRGCIIDQLYLNWNAISGSHQLVFQLSYRWIWQKQSFHKCRLLQVHKNFNWTIYKYLYTKVWDFIIFNKYFSSIWRIKIRLLYEWFIKLFFLPRYA
jgi:hypothetical protein